MDNYMINKRSQILILIFILLTLISIAATYYNTLILKNFVIIDDVSSELISDE